MSKLTKEENKELFRDMVRAIGGSAPSVRKQVNTAYTGWRLGRMIKSLFRW